MKVKTSPETDKSDMKRVLPRNRIKYSAQQLHRLEKVFMSTQYPDSSILDELSSTVNVNVERLSIWFQNRRSKFKRQNKDGHTSWMRQQLYQQTAPQSRAACSQSSDKGHVLSPPSENRLTVQHTNKPSSNLHYMPTSGSSCALAPDTTDSCRLMMPSTTTSAHTSAMDPASEAAYNSSHLSFLVQEMSYPHSTYYSTVPGHPQPSGVAPATDAPCYPQSFSPYYGGFGSATVGYPQVGV